MEGISTQGFFFFKICAFLAFFYVTFFPHLFDRYDYETVELDPANKMIVKLRHLVSDSNFVGTKYSGVGGSGEKTYEVKYGDDFYYEDPIDRSIAKQQVHCMSLYNEII